MTSIKLIVTGAAARAEVDGLLTSGMVGIPVIIEYDDAWDGLSKNLVCRSSAGARVVLDVGNAATVPHEVMGTDERVYFDKLYIGVEGYNSDGTLVIPTIWADCGRIYPGANSDADPSADPTLPVYEQLKQKIEDLENNGGGNAELDTSLSESGAAADAAATGQAIAAISGLRWRGEYIDGMSFSDNDVFVMDGTVMIYHETPDNEEMAGYWEPFKGLNEWIANQNSSENTDQSSGLISAVKTALLNAFAHVAWTDENGQSYYNALYEALYGDVTFVTGIELSKSGESIYTGYDTTVTATVSPSNATDKSVVWTSSDEAVAIIEGSGDTVTVKGIADGSSVITATTVDGGYIDTFTVTVATAVPTKVTLTPTTATVKEGSTQTITATVEPTEAEDKTITWETSSESIATVTPSADTLSCVVNGVGEGTATITAKTNMGNVTATATVEISAGEVVYLADVGTVVKESAQVNVGSAANIGWGTNGAITYATGYSYSKVLSVTDVKTGDVIVVPLGRVTEDSAFADVSTEDTGVSVSDMVATTMMDNYSWCKFTLTATRDIAQLYITYRADYDSDDKCRATWKKA